MLALDASAELFDDDVVDPASFAVHADLDPVADENVCEVLAGESATLVAVEGRRRRP